MRERCCGSPAARSPGAAAQLAFGGPELDDIADQAADDATLAVLAKLAGFRGESRFTTWAAKFAILEVSARSVATSGARPASTSTPTAWERMPDRFGLGPGQEAETHELLAGLRRRRRDRADRSPASRLRGDRPQ